MFKKDDQVSVTLGEMTVTGTVTLASENGRALAIDLDVPLRVTENLAFATLMPYQDDKGKWWAYVDVEVLIQPVN